MRALLIAAISLGIATAAAAQTQKPAAAPAKQTRYFTISGGTIGGESVDVDAVITENLQGGTVRSAAIDVCFPSTLTSRHLDRLKLPLTAAGQALTGEGTSLIDHASVSVKLNRKPDGADFDIAGEIRRDQGVTVKLDAPGTSADTDGPLAPGDADVMLEPADSSPNALSIETSLEKVSALLPKLKQEGVWIEPDTLFPNCDDLRRDRTFVDITVNPSRAAALKGELEQAGYKVAPRGGNYGYSSAVRISGQGTDILQIVTPIIPALTRELSATVLGSPAVDPSTGLAEIVFDQVSPVAGADLVTRSRVKMLLAPEQGSGSGAQVLYFGEYSASMIDRGPDPKLRFGDYATGSGEDEGGGAQEGDRLMSIIVRTAARELHGQTWDLETSAWKQ
jgi:hypothetical protein